MKWKRPDPRVIKTFAIYLVQFAAVLLGIGFLSFFLKSLWDILGFWFSAGLIGGALLGLFAVILWDEAEQAVKDQDGANE